MNTDYEKQANDFLLKTGTAFNATFIGNWPYFDDKDTPRDVYKITLTRGAKFMTFTFGQSIASSGLTVKRNPYGKTVEDHAFIPRKGGRIIPSPYDVLTSLEKSNPGSFEDFCSNFGYDADSKKAEKIFLAVNKQYHDLHKLFSEDELILMMEIQ